VDSGALALITISNHHDMLTNIIGKLRSSILATKTLTLNKVNHILLLIAEKVFLSLTCYIRKEELDSSERDLFSRTE
jgi:hypothetical protein